MSKAQIIKIFKLGNAYTEILAGLKFEKDLILQLLREEIMQESTIYQYILQKGEQQGEQRGEQRGKQQGVLKYTLRLLHKRFGTIDSVIIERLNMLSTEQLENLGEDFLDFSNVSDLVAWLEQNTNN